MSLYYDRSPPHPCERLARMQGQTNYWQLLVGLEEACDTTEDMAALAMSRQSGMPPELLEAFWGGSPAHRKALCVMTFRALPQCGFKIADHDRAWVLAAVVDAFDRFCGKKRRAASMAKRFSVRLEDYLATRKFIEGLLWAWTGEVQPAWIRARFGRE